MSYITELKVSMNYAEEQSLEKEGFNKCDTRIGKTEGGDLVYLWYKNETGSGITRIQFSYTNEMAKNLEASRYKKVEKNINTSRSGDPVYLWYHKSTDERHVPIKEIDVSTTDVPQNFKDGWERQGFNLNRKDGREHVFLWVKREETTYIQQMLISDSYDYDITLFKAGYIRVDESTNRSDKGNPVFLWYLPSTKLKGSYEALDVTNNMVTHSGYNILVAPPVNLNKGNAGKTINLLYKLEDSGQKPIQALFLIYDSGRMEEYEKAGVIFRSENLNGGKGSPCFPATPLYLGYYQ